MSLESAITELAAAIRELAKSNGPQARTEAHGYTTNPPAEVIAADMIEADVTKVETDAKAEQKKVMAQVEADRKPSAAKEAIIKALDAAKAENEQKAADFQKKIDADKAAAQAAAPAPAVEEDDPLADSTPLDYEKDVKPKLVQVGKNKQEMVDLLASFGVGKELTYAKADQLPADKFGAVVAACDKILAARG